MRALVGIENLPWTGAFSLTDQLEMTRTVAGGSSYDWIVHADADEWLVSPVKGQRLIDAIQDADASGFNVINFHELVFMPPPDVSLHNQDYASLMRDYYFFQPYFPRLDRIWRRDAMLDNARSGDHPVAGTSVKPYPNNLILRHSIAPSQQYAEAKYLNLRFSEADLKKGWHRNRIMIDQTSIRVRSSPALRRLPSPLDHDQCDLSHPVAAHFRQ